MDIIHAASLLYFWGWDDMIQVAKRLVSLICSEPGVLIIGIEPTLN